jgi:hypothetical protein
MNEQNKIKSFEEACQVLSIQTVVAGLSNFPEQFRKSIECNYKLMVIAEATNKTAGDDNMPWTPDWNNSDEWKYYPWFEVIQDHSKPSGFRLSYHGYDCGGTRTLVGSRLCFRDAETAEYIGKQFIDLYEGSFFKPRA